jgi:flagellar biosynthetic protein FliP
MLTAVLSVVAALAFVLGLGALCLWALKRWGAGPLRPRTRVAVEVVQRVPLGPKTGLAVVRVGDKVMAVSVGDGGVRPLFELDEADRQRVIATSTVPMPVASSREASVAWAELTPAALSTTFGSLLGRSLTADAKVSPVAPVVAPAVAPVAIPSSLQPAPALAVTDRAEIPAFLTAPRAPAAADRDFRSMLGVSLSGATRLAVLAGTMVLLGAQTLSAQPTGTGTGSGAGAGAAGATPTPLQPPAPPVIAPPPAPPAATGNTAGTTTGPAARPVTPTAVRPATPAAAGAPRRGNGSEVNAQGTATRRETNRMQLDSMAKANPTAQSASPAPIAADDAIMRMMPQMDVKLGGSGEGEGLRLNGTVGIVVMMGLLTLLPTLLLMMTGFTRILIVLHFLKQAMGTQSAPPGQLLAGMALLLTGFVMGPTLSEVNRTAITPWLDGQITQVEMMKTGVQPMRTFMLKQTRETDLKAFVEMSRMPRPATVDDVPLHVLMSAFVASELRTAFQIGFAIYLPFIIIDAVVASVLMSMGMMMLPPAMISLPFKLLLFVLVDGWSLTITSLVQSFK